jgi:hypothetical protein
MAPKRPAKPRAKAEEPTPQPEPEATPPPPEPVVQAPPQPSYAPPPKRSLAPIVTAVLLVLALAVTLFGVLRNRGHHKAFELKLGVATAASVGDLRSFASAGRPIYWIGPPKSGTLEVTRVASGAVYVRYLPPGVKVGDRTPGYTTFATYPSANAYTTLSRSGRAAGAVRVGVPRHGLAVWRVSQATSVYVAYPGTDYLIEVFDPSPRRARALALSRRLQPIS